MADKTYFETLLSFSDRVVFVTGASRGIGRAIALVFARAGARVALVSRTAEQLQEVADEVVHRVARPWLCY